MFTVIFIFRLECLKLSSRWEGGVSLGEPTQCDHPPLRALTPCWSSGPPSQSLLYCSIVLPYSPHEASVGYNLNCWFLLEIGPANWLTAWLMRLPKTVHFSCPHHPWQPRCTARQCKEVSRACPAHAPSCECSGRDSTREKLHQGGI